MVNLEWNIGEASIPLKALKTAKTNFMQIYIHLTDNVNRLRQTERKADGSIHYATLFDDQK